MIVLTLSHSQPHLQIPGDQRSLNPKNIIYITMYIDEVSG